MPGTRSDVSIKFGSSLQHSYKSEIVVYRSASAVIRYTDTGYHFTYEDGTEFLVSLAGDQVIASTPEGLAVEDTCTYLVGPVMGFVLRLHGVVCLHASVVIINDRAVAFCGPPGAGKSTMAAALAQLGCPVLAEDVAALDDHGNSFYVRPGYPRVNLWPESVIALYGSAELLPTITPNWEKRYLALDSGAAQFHASPSPLAAIYIIGERRPQPEPEIRPLQSLEALIALASNTYTPYLLNTVMKAREFDVLTRLVKYVPIRRVLPSTDISDIGRLCNGLLKDYESIR